MILLLRYIDYELVIYQLKTKIQKCTCGSSFQSYLPIQIGNPVYYYIYYSIWEKEWTLNVNYSSEKDV